MLSEHVYCVAIAFKMTEWAEQQICIKFCVKLEHSSVENIQIIQKAAAMGNWWLAASSQYPAHASCLLQFFYKTLNHPGESTPLQPRFGALWLLLFPKLSSPLKGKRFRPLLRFRKILQGNWWRFPTKDFAECFKQWKRSWENCVRPQGAYFEGDWNVIVLCTMFLVSCIFFNKCLYFS